MPALVARYSSRVYTKPSQLPPALWRTFESMPRDSNVMYPHALKLLDKERSGHIVEGNTWITCSERHMDSDSIDFVLSCTEGPLGPYPVFISSARPTENMDFTYIFPRILRLVNDLAQAVPVERVFSIFAPDRLAHIFCVLWAEKTGVQFYDEPYYAAKLTHCSSRSLSPKRHLTLHPDLEYDFRLGSEEDILPAAELCYGFAAESEPFTLTQTQALQEASLLISQKQLWVHIVRERATGQEAIASIVAVTRESSEVSAITKVYTSRDWRRLGCAERLVRHVCQVLLKRRKEIILYVAHNNPGAAKVYHRVGFAGLDGPEPIDGVTSWTEIGFDRGKVQLGHW